MIFGINFATPAVLWLLLLLVPGLLLFFWWSWRKGESLMTRFIQARLLPGLTSGVSPARRKLRLACLVLAVACAIVALARPLGGLNYEQVRQRGLDIIVALDTSKSMLANDLAPDRLTRAKLAALDLMRRAKSDRLGLVAFAGNAFLQCPLTIDDVAFRQSVDALNVNTLPQGGTAIADAIQTAQKAFKEGDNHKVIVILSDGEDHDSGAMEAAKQAAAAGIRIYTVGIGTREGAMMPVKAPQGHMDLVRDEQHNVVKSHLDERLLQDVANATDGFYLQLSVSAIDTLFDHPQGLSSIPKSDHQEKLMAQYQERYHWPLAAAILLLLFEAVFSERKREGKPKAERTAPPSGKPSPLQQTKA
jgi:Ca-activated chloride channel homolog